MGEQRRSKRVRQHAEAASDAGSSSELGRAPTSERPTPSELQEALDVIRMMKDHGLIGQHAPAKPNIVACAIAMSRGERFETDAKALQVFGIKPRTEVRTLWLGKLAEFAPGGIGSPGEPSLPAYLLEREQVRACCARARSRAARKPN